LPIVIENRFHYVSSVASSRTAPSLDELALGEKAVVARIAGDRTFRRRLMEMGLVPGTEVTLVNIAPLGDPLEIELRDSRLSIRRREAVEVLLEP